MKYDEFFRKHPIFSIEELREYLSPNNKTGVRAQGSLLAYHLKSGRLARIRRGLYAFIPPGAKAEAYPVDPFLIAAKMARNAVLSHHTALEFHGRAHSVQELFTYSATRPQRPLTFRGQVFRGTMFPLVLLRTGREHFGVLTSERAGMELRVAGLERTLVDVLDRPELTGSWEEIWRSLESVEFFDLDRVVEYALLLDNATTGAKVGFFLEQHRESLKVEDRHLKALRDLRPRQPHYLDRSRRRSGRLVSDWNLVVPQEVLERKWGEVL